VLGPLAERSFRQSVLGSQGDPLIFFERPISGTFMLIAVLLFLYPLAMNIRRIRARRAAASQSAE
jgi:putative tricarboxylic transport membrane protein